ncbi:VWA domain-containing protein [Streptomyces sp. S816]|uniref:vWA domain-containing protein n=1 Tax=Streptomyces sp. S816 TaxID=2283197 RepID=UPI00109C065E|nr:VWA domain-containing protein [Streptomyces sp. S816]TGZ14588.1 VWA domain-containing protein [Streptomyces sp. S816]
MAGGGRAQSGRARVPAAGPAGADAVLLGFVRALRAAGVDASAERMYAFLRAVAVLRPGMRADVYAAGRATLCGGPDDLERYERVFAAYFGATAGSPPLPTVRTPPPPRPRLRARDASGGGRSPGEREPPAPPTAALASSTEVLRHRDIAALDAVERAQLHRLLAAFALRGEARRSARRRPARRGEVDPRRTVRELLRRGGEPARLRRHARVDRPRRVVLLVDVSGSMAPYADALLRFAHAAARGGRTEVFTVGTRLTRVTRELSARDPDLAMAAVAAAVPDWRGGTRLGELLREFLNRWGQRGMARGAIVVLLSDGWERDDPALLGAQMRRLHALAHRVVWANPRKARPGYAPTAAGMAAALPSVDAFVEGHSLAALERLAAVVRGADTGAAVGAGAERRSTAGP